MKGHHILGFNLHVFDVGEVEFKPHMQDGSSIALREMKSTGRLHPLTAAHHEADGSHRLPLHDGPVVRG